MPSVPWRVEFSKIFNFFFSKFQKGPKSFPKVSKRVLNLFWVKFFENFFAQCSVEGRVFENFQKKIFSKFQKCPKVFSKVSKRVLNMFWGKFFEKNFAQFSMEGRVFENFQKKIKKVSNFLKCPKLFPKVSKRVLNVFWGKLSNIFCPVFHGMSSLRKFSKKKFFQNSKIAQKCSQMYPNVF